MSFHDRIGNDWTFRVSHPADLAPICATAMGTRSFVAAWTARTCAGRWHRPVRQPPATCIGTGPEMRLRRPLNRAECAESSAIFSRTATLRQNTAIDRCN